MDDLYGSESQIKWALSIKHEWIAAAKKMYDLNISQPGLPDFYHKICLDVMNMFIEKTNMIKSAKHFIDNRMVNPYDLYSILVAEEYEKATKN